MGVVTVEYLEKIAAVARKHDIPLVKITSAQRLAFAGHAPEMVAEIWHDLGQESGPVKPVGIHLSDEQVVALAGKCLDFYQAQAGKFERTGRFMQRTTLAKLKEAIGR
jgi:NAD(P)H-nitrite reductase large subunit